MPIMCWPSRLFQHLVVKERRSFRWLGNFRRLLIRWEHCSSVYRAFFVVALGLICIKRLLRAQKNESAPTPS
jgi:hypothetical protein